jgi:tetratricopeptide (TPR) repeat protein
MRLSIGVLLLATAQSEPQRATCDEERLRSIEQTISREALAGRWEAVERWGQAAARCGAAENSGTLLGIADTLAATNRIEIRSVVGALVEKSLELGVPPDDGKALACLTRLSDYFFDAGEWVLSEFVDRNIVKRLRDAHGADHPLVGDALTNHGLSLHRLGRLTEAEQSYAAAVQILEPLAEDQPVTAAQALAYRAENLRARGDVGQAGPLLERAVRIGEQRFPADPALVSMLVNLAGAYKDSGRLGLASARLKDAQALAERAGVGEVFAALIPNNLAEVARLSGDEQQAETLYRQAIEEGRKTMGPDHPRVATYHNQLAVLYRDQGRLAEAEPLYREALRIREARLGADHPDLAFTLQDLGELLSLQGRHEAALASLDKALAIREARLGPQHADVALSLVALAEARGRAGLAEAQVRRLLDRSITVLDAAATEPGLLVRALLDRSELSRQAGKKDEARADLVRAVELVDRLRPQAAGSERTRARYLARHVEAFRSLALLEVERGDLAAAFAATERGRARALLDQLGAAGVDLRAGIEPVERARLEKQESEALADLNEARERLAVLRGLPSASTRQAEIDTLEQRRQAAESAFQRVYEDLRNASPAWRERGLVATAPDLPALQRDLVGPDGLLLEYVIGARESAVLVLPPPGETALALPLKIDAEAARLLRLPEGPLGGPDLARALAGGGEAPGVLEQLTAPPLTGTVRTALLRRLHALARVLVPEPLRARLGRAREVMVLPDGALHRLPLEALAMEMPAAGQPVVSWIDVAPPIRYGASIGVLQRLAARPPRKDAGLELLTVADPAFRTGPGSAFAGLQRLPGAAREADAAARAFAGRAVLSLADRAATEGAVRAALPRARHLLLATHGVVDEAGGDLFAALALAAGEPGDGQLQLFEIHDLGLDAELALLSACESRIGSAVEGEGSFALSRGFLAAGARRVVASLWPVGDDATAELVGRFWEKVAEDQRAGRRPDYAAALAAGRRAVRERWPDPFFWAAFVLEGAR